MLNEKKTIFNNNDVLAIARVTNKRGDDCEHACQTGKRKPLYVQNARRKGRQQQKDGARGRVGEVRFQASASSRKETDRLGSAVGCWENAEGCKVNVVDEENRYNNVSQQRVKMD